MSFISDKQTQDDLNLFGKFRPHSIYSLFNKVNTTGGERLLDEFFHKPLTDPGSINQRSQLFRYFHEKQLQFPFRHTPFSVVENYLNSAVAGNSVTATIGVLRKKWMGSFLRDEQFEQIQTGLAGTIEMLHTLRELIRNIELPLVEPARNILADPRLDWVSKEQGTTSFSVLKMAGYDLLLRKTMQREMEILLNCVYQLDVFIHVSAVARERGFHYAVALPATENNFTTTALWHPAIGNAVANPLSLHSNNNVLFLTGANMAGKSTFMKSFGIAVYLAHIGFPVAAADLEFSVRDGLFSSINVSDNLNMGYSHFYAEVLRVKNVATEVSNGHNLIVIFDELFKGTNVKDAYDATLAVTTAFAQYRNCFFIISTHIIEVGEALKQHHSNLQFAYLPTKMEGTVPKYTYQLTAGITSDRHGMIIIRNEKILDMIR